MFELLLWLTGIIPMASAAVAYKRTRDPFHPMIYLGLMITYIYAFLPATYFYRGLIENAFRDESSLIFAQAIHILSIAACCAGCLWPRRTGTATCFTGRIMDMPQALRNNLARLSFLLAAIGLAAYLYHLSMAGGFFEAYSRPKGGYVRGISGYVTSLPFMTILATGLYAISQQGKPIRARTTFLMLLFMSPHIIQGTFGGSRGAAFLSAVTLTFAWFTARSQRPSIGFMISILFAIGVLMLSLKVYRQTLYLGSEKQLEKRPLMEILMPQELNISDATTYSWGLIIVTHHHQRYFWGRRYLAQILVRPVPRQLWPTKYEDLGVDWMVTRPGTGGFSFTEWKTAVGWFPQAGSSTGFVADAFAEFSWGGLVVCFLVGLLYGTLWKRAAMQRGFWIVIYLEAAAVSIYLVTQGTASAWMYRLLFLTIPTYLFWRWMIGPRLAIQSRPVPVQGMPPRP